MRTALVLPTAAVAAGLAGSGIAAAASPTPLPAPPSITVNGSASQAVASGSTGDQLSADYQTALAAALTAAQAKATFVAGRESVTLGALQNVTENSDVPTMACGGVASAPASAVGLPGKSGGKKNRKKNTHKPTGKKAQIALPVDDCTVSAQVTVTYLIAGPAAATTTTTSTTNSTLTTATATPVATTTTTAAP